MLSLDETDEVIVLDNGMGCFNLPAFRRSVAPTPALVIKEEEREIDSFSVKEEDDLWHDSAESFLATDDSFEDVKPDVTGFFDMDESDLSDLEPTPTSSPEYAPSVKEEDLDEVPELDVNRAASPYAPSASPFPEAKPKKGKMKAKEPTEEEIRAAMEAEEEQLAEYCAEYAKRRADLAAGKSDRPDCLDDKFNPFDVDTWGRIDVENDDTRFLNNLGAFHISDLGGRHQGWWSNPWERLRLKYGVDGEDSQWGTPRMTILRDNGVNINCRGAGKALAFLWGIVDGYSNLPIATFVRDHKMPQADERKKKGEGWRAYGMYHSLPGFLPTARDFLRLTPSKQVETIDKFMHILRSKANPEIIDRAIFDDIFLPPLADEDKPRPLWKTRLTASKEEQEAAIRTALETRGLNIAFNLFRYVEPNEVEVGDCVENRLGGRITRDIKEREKLAQKRKKEAEKAAAKAAAEAEAAKVKQEEEEERKPDEAAMAAAIGGKNKNGGGKKTSGKNKKAVAEPAAKEKKRGAPSEKQKTNKRTKK